MEQSVKCLHIADLHFGVDNYGYTNPQTGLNTRLEDFSKSFGFAIDHAIENEVDLVLFAGDAYKRNSPSPTEQRELVKHFCRLADAGIPTVMISGNHDIPVMHGRAASIDIFRSLRPEKFFIYVNQPTLGENKPPMIETKNGPIGVCCLPYISPSFLRQNERFKELKGDALKEAYEEFFTDVIYAMANELPEEIPKVFMGHLTVHGCSIGAYRGVALMSDEIQILPATLAHSGYDYVALGHIHQHQNLSPRKEVPVVYSGSIDRVDFGEVDERKGFVIAEIQKGGADFEFHPIPVREFVDIYVEYDENVELTERVRKEIQKENVIDAIVRVRYVATDEESQSLDAKAIHQELQVAHYKIGFIRIPKDKPAARRSTTLSQDVQLVDALEAYISEREELKEEKDALIEKAKEIDQVVRGEL